LTASGLAAAAAKRLEERRTLRTGPLAAAQKALWEALLRGNIEEASNTSTSSSASAVHSHPRRWRSS